VDVVPLLESLQTTLRAPDSRALIAYQNKARSFIGRPVTTETGTTWTHSSGSLENVDWLIAKRAAEIDNAA
jgi:hypothetical protein